MAIFRHAELNPDKCAVVMSTGEGALSFRELDDRSARLATALRQAGMSPGDRLALLMENEVDYLVAAWAGRRSGLRFVPINWHLKLEETAYVVDNSDARALIVSPRMADMGEKIRAATPALISCFVSGDKDVGRFRSMSNAIREAAPLAVEDSIEGVYMFYSSGTTGAPKGILRALPDEPFGATMAFEQLISTLYGFDQDTVYLCPAPLYHAAPLGWSMGAQALGGASVIMPAFDPEAALAAIERHRVTHAQFVPTHFVRMLQLPENIRNKYDLSSLKTAVHAAAPCPPDVKEQMLDWWGPVIQEYYSGSEGGGFCAITPDEWRAHRGSVGRSYQGAIHIVGEDGRDVPTGEIGAVYFEDSQPFEYHKEPGKTAEFFNDKGWGTLGDMGYVDEDGYLYLADRKSHMIISGGVNIYPQEIENVLGEHPAVADVGVIGVPNREFGEEVKAVVELMPGQTGDDRLTADILAFCRERLANFKLPRTIDYVDQLPRLPNGKLMKRELRAPYWSADNKIKI